MQLFVARIADAALSGVWGGVRSGPSGDDESGATGGAKSAADGGAAGGAHERGGRRAGVADDCECECAGLVCQFRADRVRSLDCSGTVLAGAANCRMDRVQAVAGGPSARPKRVSPGGRAADRLLRNCRGIQRAAGDGGAAAFAAGDGSAGGRSFQT